MTHRDEFLSARFAGVCPDCGLPINKGDLITRARWVEKPRPGEFLDRTEAGKSVATAYVHAPYCPKPERS